jgi:hypothetical protein
MYHGQLLVLMPGCWRVDKGGCLEQAYTPASRQGFHGKQCSSSCQKCGTGSSKRSAEQAARASCVGTKQQTSSASSSLCYHSDCQSVYSVLQLNEG